MTTNSASIYRGDAQAGGDADQFYISRTGQEFGPYTLRDLQDLAAGGQLKPDTDVRRTSGRRWVPAKEIPWVFSDKEWLIALVISGFLGVFGIDRFYLGYTGIGIAKLLTIGGFGIWALTDFVLITVRKVPDANGRPLR
jgi:TM2 domain/GYF domain 2